MKLSEIKQILASRQIQLTKSLGQNFLHDENQLRRIVAAAGISPGDQVLEIGPGLGALTKHLLNAGAEVTAIEKDLRLVEFLTHHYAGEPRLRLIHGDALHQLQSGDQSWIGWKAVSNLPYSVASPILIELSQTRFPPRRITATVQFEVAQRLISGPGSADYGVLTLLVTVQFTPSGWFRIPASCFFPPPKIDSACVTLDKRSKPLLEPEQLSVFTRLVKVSFSQRRKMMLKLLKEVWPGDRLEDAFRSLNLPPDVRAEKVGVNEFAELAKRLSEA